MIGQKSSSYLSNDFLNLTSECYTEVNKLFNRDFNAFTGANETVNSLVSDTHWFQEKIRKIKLQDTTAQELSDSNVVSKYSRLESLKVQLIGF